MKNEQKREAQRIRSVAAAKRSHAALRREVLSAYGGRCACCGEANFLFLVLDHTNGDGQKDRAQFGSDTYRRARTGGYPPNYQVLCANCNQAKGNDKGSTCRGHAL